MAQHTIKAKNNIVYNFTQLNEKISLEKAKLAKKVHYIYMFVEIQFFLKSLYV
jgi:hypothetical protein